MNNKNKSFFNRFNSCSNSWHINSNRKEIIFHDQICLFGTYWEIIDDLDVFFLSGLFFICVVAFCCSYVLVSGRRHRNQISNKLKRIKKFERCFCLFFLSSKILTVPIEKTQITKKKKFQIFREMFALFLC